MAPPSHRKRASIPRKPPRSQALVEGPPGPLARLGRKRAEAFLAAALAMGARASAGTVHDLRVGARRLRLLLEEAAALWRRRGRARRAARSIRAMGLLVAPARDADVSLDLARRSCRRGDPCPRLLATREKRRRARALGRAEAAWRGLLSRARLEDLAGLIQELRGAPAEPLLGRAAAAAAAARRALRSVRGLTPSSAARRWHAVRKTLRRARYAWEDLAEIGAGPGRERLETLVRMQGLLGDAQDLALLSRRAGKAAAVAGANSPGRAALSRLGAWAERRRRGLLSRFLTGWTRLEAALHS